MQEFAQPIDLKRDTYLKLLNLLNFYSKEEGLAEKATSILKRAFTPENKLGQESIQQDIKQLSVFLRQHVKIVGTLERIKNEMNKLEDNLQKFNFRKRISCFYAMA